MDSETKVDKKKVMSQARLDNLKKMCEKLAEKKRLEKLERENPKSVERESTPIPEEYEEVVAIEKPVPIPRKERKVALDSYSSLSLEDTVRSIVEKSLPPEFSKEARKKAKWNSHKDEIKNEILKSLKSLNNNTKEPVTRQVPGETAKIVSGFSLDDLFS